MEGGREGGGAPEPGGGSQARLASQTGIWTCTAPLDCCAPVFEEKKGNDVIPDPGLSGWKNTWFRLFHPRTTIWYYFPITLVQDKEGAPQWKRCGAWEKKKGGGSENGWIRIKSRNNKKEKNRFGLFIFFFFIYNIFICFYCLRFLYIYFFYIFFSRF